ncbi:hypothetical protein C1Y41_04410 [Pantoea sp. ICBG 1758]|uniref:hypothetical protein n=1 Tax=Pantoea sp. ICBG 1758 TaxID=2071682 RepID=UPI000CE3CBBC|nr:hypothetical protein [Pantoea sp. ICBG 1758]PPC63893.1 hypothetical protein C1Y41_04410 [Pantoea sp. ICBG 1758]
MDHLEITHNQEFAFAAVAAMSLVSFATGPQTENELEEIYIQLHDSRRLIQEIEFSLEALDEVKERLQLNYPDAQEAILSDLGRMELDHEEAVEIVNMALDVVKSNKDVEPEKMDVISGLCKVLNLYSEQFNFIT